MIIAISRMIAYNHTELKDLLPLPWLDVKLEMSGHTVTTLRTLTMDSLSLCVMMSSVDTLTAHHPLEFNKTEKFYMTQVKQAIKISALVAHRHSDSGTSCSHLISNYFPQYWCRKNKNATGIGVDQNCFGPCSVCKRAA